MACKGFGLEHMGGGLHRLACYVSPDVAVVIYDAGIWMLDDFGAEGFVLAVETHSDGEYEYSGATLFPTEADALAYGALIAGRPIEAAAIARDAQIAGRPIKTLAALKGATKP